MIKIKTFVFNVFQENTYILHDETCECVVVDPGVSTNIEKTEFDNYIVSNKLKPIAIVNTHCHIDHILGCKFLKEKYNIPFYTHEKEIILVEKAREYGVFFNIEIEDPPKPDKFLKDGDAFLFGNSVLFISHVPGHSPGSICLYSEIDKFILTGDVLFEGSIGRTDLPGSDPKVLINNIKTKLLTLPRDVIVFPGHGPYTTIGQEHDTNPFL
jgi:hydroxyacylglutathione hydrolase